MEEEKLNTERFEFLYGELLLIEDEVPWADQGQLHLLKMDAKNLKAFCFCFETWNYISTTDEDTMEDLRSVWMKDQSFFSLYFDRMIRMGIQDFNSVMFDLESKFLQSKQLIQGWYRNSIHSKSSMQVQCKSSSFSQIFNILDHLRENLISSYRNNLTLNKQIAILKAKILFLETKSKNIQHCPDGKKILRFRNFIGVFAISVASLTFLHRAKEDSDEFASEMNIFIFDMLQKLIPYAYDIIPLFISILKAYDLHPELASDSFLLGEAVEEFVDFFFEHLAIFLNDDFLILRDHLIFLFTFLTDPPCEKNTEEERDIIHSQIYAILHEEMNKDFSDKYEVLNGCMIKIDTANAKIRQLYHGSSDTWITLEVEKMEYNCFICVHKELSWIEKHAKWADMDLVQSYRMYLRFLRVFLLCLATWDDTDEEIKECLSSTITNFRVIWCEKEEEELLSHRLHTIRTGDIIDWDPLSSELDGKLLQSMLQTEAWCVNLFHWSPQFKASTSYTILKFLDSIISNLDDVVTYKAKIVLFKNQIETMKEKLVFLKRFLKLAVNSANYEELGEFKVFVQAFANDAVILTFFYWTRDANDETASETNSKLSHMLQKIKPITPDVARLYFGILMSIYVQRSDSHMFGQTACSFVDFLFEDPVTHLKDDFQILQDNIVFLLTFLNDPPNKNAEKLICSQIDVRFWEGLYCLLPFDYMECGLSTKKELLSDFMLKIEAINANIRHIYSKFPDSSLYNFPKVISPYFLDFLIHNLGNLMDMMNSDRKYAPFAKFRIAKIEKELVCLCPFFIHIFDLKSELNEAWSEVVDVLHLTEHVIMSCISSWFVFDNPIWYHMAYLSDIFDDIKVVKTKLEKINYTFIYNARCLPDSAGFVGELAEQAGPVEINEIVVGFEDEAEKIIDRLIRGTKSLDIVSIVGMGGLGKTTLARKVCGSLSVNCNFHVFAFCCVSQVHNTRRLLLNILRDMKKVDDKTLDMMTNDDLAHQLRKCLSRQKYLIVLDDIWDVTAWNVIKSSFPYDKNGSRVMLTTRSREVADKCKINCSPHQLRFLFEDESWELLQKKVFRNGISPPYLYDIGKQIAKNCKGLALAVAVIAGLLARTEKTLMWWNEVAQRLVFYLSDGGCMEILELSYKHLPENLKPCLLYLGAFPEDSLIKVRHVIQLWIAEGFVQESKTTNIEDVAKEYFHDLVARSFVIIDARSSIGGIKTFRVHDLIHVLCQTKCREESFFHLNHKISSTISPNPFITNHYRVSTQNESDVTNIDVGSSLSNARSVHFYCEDRDGRINGRISSFPLRKFGLAHVLDLNLIWVGNCINQLTSMIHLRHIDTGFLKLHSLPSSISNLWNIVSLTLISASFGNIHLPQNFWRMKSLRHVKVVGCILTFSDGEEHESYLPTDELMDKVVSFSKPVLYSGKDVKRLLQRLPGVRNLSCLLEESHVYDEESIETLDFRSELESLKVIQSLNPIIDKIKTRQYMINFPSTLKKLTLEQFMLPGTALSAIAELHCLEVLKLRYGSLVEPILETEDLVFRNLKFFQLFDRYLVEWNASFESFPCLEILEIQCEKLEELPPCFGENSTLKKIAVSFGTAAENSARSIQEELTELGIQVEVLDLQPSDQSRYIFHIEL